MPLPRPLFPLTCPGMHFTHECVHFPFGTLFLPSAEAVVQALTCPAAENRAFALASTEGAGPGNDAKAWATLFAGAQP